MVHNSIKHQLQSILDKLNKLRISVEESKSLLLKLYILKKFGYLSEKHRESEFVSLEQLIKGRNTDIFHFYQQVESFLVSKVLISKDIIDLILDIDAIESTHDLFSILQADAKQREIGQYFTSKETISKINKEIFSDNPTSDKMHTIIDFSAGLGDFIIPLMEKTELTIYALELDKLSYEYCIFNLICNPKLSKQRIYSLLLTIRNGDAISGFDEKVFSDLCKNLEARKLMQDYLALRHSSINRPNLFLKEDIIRAFSIRKQIGNLNKKFKKFNWFIDFPERFLDYDLNFTDALYFDFVIGNPPWIIYGAFLKKEYQSILSSTPFSRYLYGKYNFSLPFLILALRLTRKKGALVLPQGIISESYGKLVREKLLKEKTLTKIELCESKLFEKVVNDYCIIYWDKDSNNDTFQIQDNKNLKTIQVAFTSLVNSHYKIPRLPSQYSALVKKVHSNSVLLKEIVFVRRGLTLTKKYQQFYSKFDFENSSIEQNKLIKHNTFKSLKKDGIMNFQVFYDGDKFVYDKKLLGAPGDSSLFERKKIIRRNRGRMWYIGLDMSKEIYVNDIFDIIYSKDDKVSLKALFSYLSSSLVQFLTEYFI
ncbi:MAG: N-6 DNA methylase, partial [Candidatus Heimdallarchaeota archaeon]|nr:N-6 DNA methylase [Candidatus Heimdallarchaeota archaeon]MCK4253642.1 N-6 DNA methylase [Candidatus Heimdallarchaeota archaeon]